MIEEWKDIEGYPDYMVSNLGRVKSLKFGKGKILKPQTLNNGYLIIGLSQNGKRTPFLIHRLVAEAFIPNLDNKHCIDHINTIRTDNRVENLRWCTQKENLNNPITKIYISERQKGEKGYWYGKLGKESKNSKPILQISTNGEFIKKWDCIKDVERELGFNNSNISKCCCGKGYYKTAYGYIWKYYDIELYCISKIKLWLNTIKKVAI